MTFSPTEDPKQWEYKIDSKSYKVTIDDYLESRLLKETFKPEQDSDKRIIKLKNIPIEKILEEIIGNTYRDYHFSSDEDRTRFNLAIQQIEKKSEKNLFPSLNRAESI